MHVTQSFMNSGELGVLFVYVKWEIQLIGFNDFLDQS